MFKTDGGWRWLRTRGARFYCSLAAGCKHVQPLDTKPLDAAGMDYARSSSLLR